MVTLTTWSSQSSCTWNLQLVDVKWRDVAVEKSSLGPHGCRQGLPLHRFLHFSMKSSLETGSLRELLMAGCTGTRNHREKQHGKIQTDKRKSLHPRIALLCSHVGIQIPHSHGKGGQKEP